MDKVNNYEFKFSNWGWLVFKLAFLAGAGAMVGVLTMICVTIAVVKAVH